MTYELCFMMLFTSGLAIALGLLDNTHLAKSPMC